MFAVGVTVPSTSSASPSLAVIIGAVAGVLVLFIIIVIVVVVVMKRRSRSPQDEAPSRPGPQVHQNEAYYMEPMKGEEGEEEYAEIPADHVPEPPSRERMYQKLGNVETQRNDYDVVRR